MVLTNTGYSAISNCVIQLVMIIFVGASIHKAIIGVWQRRLRLRCCSPTGKPQNLQVASVLSLSATRCAKTCPKGSGAQRRKAR